MRIGKIAGKGGGQAEFPKILLGERCLRILDRLEVLGLDFLVDFPSIDRDAFRGINADTDHFAIHALDQQNNVVPDLDGFADFS